MFVSDDVCFKQLPLKHWIAIPFSTLFNWPYATITVKLPDISFTRSNLHEFTRYVSIASDISKLPKVDYISYVKTFQEDVQQVVYPNELIKEYIEKFCGFLHWMYEVRRKYCLWI